MKLIRKGVFETNSSSCHAIVVDHNLLTKEEKISKNGILKIDVDESYGWNGECKTSQEKLNYISQ